MSNDKALNAWIKLELIEAPFKTKTTNINSKREFLSMLDANWYVRYGEKGCCSLCVLRAYNTFIADDPSRDRTMDNIKKRYGC